MSYKNLLLHLDHTKACAARVDAALALASSQDAHLVGLYCIGELHVPGWVDVAPDVFTARAAYQAEQAESAVERFADKARRAGTSYETRTAQVPVDDIAAEVSLHARYADLTILGQTDPSDSAANGSGFPQEVIMRCGRPVLVVPYIGAVMRGAEPVIGRRIMVAWDAGREAARAVSDALPLLQQAERVDLIVVNAVKGAHRHGPEPGADIAQHLARHDVHVQVDHLQVHDLSPADTLLSLLSDRDSDLLVMGAYAHSRMREIVLGGVTRNMLEHMTVPVLMSH